LLWITLLSLPDTRSMWHIATARLPWRRGARSWS
jgi:hypothetical protein